MLERRVLRLAHATLCVLVLTACAPEALDHADPALDRFFEAVGGNDAEAAWQYMSPRIHAEHPNARASFAQTVDELYTRYGPYLKRENTGTGAGTSDQGHYVYRSGTLQYLHAEVRYKVTLLAEDERPVIAEYALEVHPKGVPLRPGPGVRALGEDLIAAFNGEAWPTFRQLLAPAKLQEHQPEKRDAFVEQVAALRARTGPLRDVTWNPPDLTTRRNGNVTQQFLAGSGAGRLRGKLVLVWVVDRWMVVNLSIRSEKSP